MLYVIYFLFASNAVHAARCQWPHNQVVTIGDDVTMFCRSEKYQFLQWKYRHNTENEWRTISDKLNISKQLDRFKINSSHEVQYDLIINGAQLSVSGTYSCVVRQDESQNVQYEAELVVLGSHPSCFTNISEFKDSIIENGHICITCSLKYSGSRKWVPTMKLSQGGRKSNIVFENRTIGNIYAKFVFVVKVNSMDHESHFACKTYFNVSSVENLTTEFIRIATNSPVYNYTWMSPKINVSFSPRNIRVTSNEHSDLNNASYVVVGDRFECFADGNPAPEYLWTIDNGEKIIKDYGSTLKIIDETLENTMISIHCTAKNGFGNISITVSNFTVSNRTIRTLHLKPDLNLTAITVAAVATSFFLMIVIIGYRRVRSAKDNQPPLQSDRNMNPSQLYPWSAYEEVQLDATDDNEAGVGTKKPFDAANASVVWTVPIYEGVARSCIAAYEEVGIGGEHQNNHRDEIVVITKTDEAEEEQIVCADGTIYTEVKMSGGNQTHDNMAKQKRKSLYNKSSYAQIDHTLKSLPAPPKCTTVGSELNRKN